MSDILLTAAAGFLATTAMSLMLYGVHWGGIANADMINAVGSLITRKEEGALGPGLLVHFSTGILIAFIYVGAWSLWGFEAFGVYAMFGLLTGAAHGLVVSFVLVALVAEHHPLEKYRKAGLGVAAAHMAGHVVYGLVVGSIAGNFLLRFEFIPVLAEVPY